MKKKKSPGTAAAGKPQTVAAVPPPAATASKPASTSAFKGFILLVVSIVLLLVFFGLDSNKLWFNERIMGYWDDFKEQKMNLDIEERKQARYQTDYLFAKDVTAFFQKKGIADKVLVLMPPTEYFTANKINIHVPEPAVFYYYAGLKTIWANSPEASQANWYVTVEQGGLRFDSVTSKAALAETIAAFNKYKIAL